MIVNIYNNKYKTQMSTLLLDYYKEMYDNVIGDLDIASTLLDNYLSNNYWIYVLCDKEDVIGFIVCYNFNNYGMTRDYLICESMYVIPSKRNSKATLLLFVTLGHIMKEMSLDCISTTFTTSKNYKNIGLVGGESVAGVMRIRLEDVVDRLDRYKNKLKLL